MKKLILIAQESVEARKDVLTALEPLYQEDYYQESPDEDPRGPASGENRVVRGGCWNSRPDECRSAYRNYEDPGYTDVCFGKDIHGFVGFRCVRRAEEPE